MSTYKKIADLTLDQDAIQVLSSLFRKCKQEHKCKKNGKTKSLPMYTPPYVIPESAKGNGTKYPKQNSDRLDYGKNPDKTQKGQLIRSYACDPETADAEFALSKREYFQLTGRRQDSDVIAYQVRQSFRPGEITPEEANRIGYEFVERFLKGNHAFIVCTHTDRHHIHNHIYWNFTRLDCTRKFRRFLKNYGYSYIMYFVRLYPHGGSI